MTPDSVRASIVSVLFSLAIILGGLAPVAAQELAKEGTFSGTWSLEGKVKSLEEDGDVLIVFDYEGKLVLEAATGGLRRAFDTECVGVSDETGGLGRCAWRDEDGDVLILQVVGEVIGPAGTLRESAGLIIAGSGKYEGIEGEFAADWLFIDSSIEPGKVIGRNTRLSGSWMRP